MSDIKLVIAYPSTGRCVSEFAYSLAGLVSYLASNGIKTLPESQVVLSLDTVKSSSIHTNRELLVRRAIDNEQTHLLFLDEDMEFAPHILDIMAGRRQPVVCVNYLIKNDSQEFVAVTEIGKRLPTTEASIGLAPIAYSGFGVSLFDLEVFRKTPQPWFLPVFCPETGTYTTEDNPCYRRIRDAGFPIYLDQDASKLVRHHGEKAWSWEQWSEKK